MNNEYGAFSIFLSLFIPFVCIMWTLARHIQKTSIHQKRLAEEAARRREDTAAKLKKIEDERAQKKADLDEHVAKIAEARQQAINKLKGN